jgi:hypothetical protein
MKLYAIQDKLSCRWFVKQDGTQKRVTLAAVSWWAIDTRIAVANWTEKDELFWN